MNRTPDRRDVLIKAGGLTLVWLILAGLWVAGRGSSAPAAEGQTSYAALADRMNDPALVGQCEFEAQSDGILICYIDRAWRQGSPAEQRQFALSIADRWAALTGNPNACVCFGTGHGAFFAIAVSRSKLDGLPFYRPLEINLSD